MEKYLDITKPRFSERILPVPWPLVISRFYCTTMTLDNIKFNILKLGGNSIVNRVKCKLSSRNFSSNFSAQVLLSRFQNQESYLGLKQPYCTRHIQMSRRKGGLNYTPLRLVSEGRACI